MHTLSLSSPDEHFYMDTDATSHMTHFQGNFLKYFPLKHHHNNYIIVGNGNVIPVQGHSDLPISPSNPSLTLKNVLYAPKLIKNLIFVHKFTRDNKVYVEFDPFGFSVKKLGTGNILLRSNSTSDLYSFHSTHGATIPSSPHSAFLSSSIWNSRLGHPGKLHFAFLVFF